MGNVKPIPDGNHSVTAGLVVKGGKQAIEYYKAAFGAQELGVSLWPDGEKVMHAELKIGDTKFYLGDEFPEMGAVSPKTLGGSPCSLNIYTEDCDALFNRAVGAGARVAPGPMGQLSDQFWGDRSGTFTDPYGYQWTIATRKEDLSKEEMERRSQEFFKQFAQQPTHA